jgi:hypothetical protein
VLYSRSGLRVFSSAILFIRRGGEFLYYQPGGLVSSLKLVLNRLLAQSPSRVGEPPGLEGGGIGREGE